MLSFLLIENVENGEFKNLLKLHQKVKNTLQKKIEAIEHYENMIDLNILQLTRRITSQNSMLKNIYGSWNGQSLRRIKQMDPVGSHGEVIMDYSLYYAHSSCHND